MIWRCLFRTLTLATLLLSATAAEHARSDDFPARNITIIVSQAVGGGNDILARLFAERLQARLGKPVGVENRVGAGGVIGAAAGARGAPGGHTLPLPTQAHIMKQFMHRHFGFQGGGCFPPDFPPATPPPVPP